MLVLRVQSPDGREWEVRHHRLLLPPWRPIPYGVGADSVFTMVIIGVFWTMAAHVILPCICFLVELPVALVRSAFSSRRRVSAVCWWPRQIKIVWETVQGEERRVAAEVAAALEKGYEGVHPEGARFVAMTPPPNPLD